MRHRPRFISHRTAPPAAGPSTRRRLFSLGAVALLLLAGLAARAQQNNTGPGGLVPFATVLADHGIVTRDAVVQALSHPEPMIRGVAAFRLAELHDPEAVPLIAAALRSEQDDIVIINFSSALQSLDVPGSATRIQSYCERDSVPARLLVHATNQLSRAQGGVCAPSLFRAYRANSSQSWRTELLSLLQQVSRNLPPESAGALVSLASDALSDPDADVRREARELLFHFGGPSGREAVAASLAQENDPARRARSREALERFGQLP